MTSDFGWPRGTVRPWRGVLHEKQLAAGGHFTDSREAAEYLSGGQDTLGEEHWRGLIIGQAAQVEAFLVHIVSHGERRLGGQQEAGCCASGYDALARVLTLAYSTGLATEAFVKALVEAALALRRRDYLVGAQFDAGYSDTPGAGPVHVITTMSSGDLPPEDEQRYAYEADLKMFEDFLHQAQQALELLAALWLELDAVLPDTMVA